MRKLFVTTFMLCFALGSSHACQAQYFVAGAFQGWSPGNSSFEMTNQGGGLFTFTATGLAAGSLQEFKITTGGWDLPNYPNGNVTGRAGSDGSMTFRYFEPDSNVGFESDFVSNWSIIGQPGFGWGDWTSGTDGPALSHLGNQIYSVTFTPLQTGVGEFKFRNTGNWDNEQFGPDGGKDGNISFEVTRLVDHTFTIDTRNGTYSVMAVPEPTAAFGLTLLGIGMVARRRKA